jgi:hypothetical protein
VTSKPSSTNYPRTFRVGSYYFLRPVCHDIERDGRRKTEDRKEPACREDRQKKVKSGNWFEVRRSLGDYSGGVPPLPIPNREVKPVSADGTAKAGE